MAWSITTYAGTQGTGSPSGWRTAMFELCRAVNEREDALGGITSQQFYKADGTQARNITMSDLLGMAMVGDDSYFKLNCERIMAWIKNNCGSFTETSGISDGWTVANLEADVGAFAFIDSPLRNTQALFFQQCQDALDRLIYARRNLTMTYGSASVDTRSNASGSDTDIEVVWDSTRGETATTGTPIRAEVYYDITRSRGSLLDPSEYGACHIVSNLQNIALYPAGMAGTVTNITFSYLAESGADGGGTISATFMGETITETLSADDTASGSLLLTGGLTLDAVNYKDLLPTVPDGCPLDGLPSTVGSYTSSISLTISNSYSIYYDIEAELTDQA